jgi:peptidoglycan/LPS O-acetylase OafA/YrhL
VAAVVLFHYPTRGFIRGGLFGVDVFFALSGFLVTAGLLDEWSDTGGIRVWRYLTRRAWRLVPALLGLLVVYLLLAMFFRDTLWFSSNPFGVYDGHPLPIARALKGVGAALLYGYNFLLATGHPTPSSLGHLWTLAIEGQFYVGWVLVVRWVVREHPRALIAVILAGAAGSACVPWLIWHGGAGANAIYFGTVPRLQQLLAGAAVAVLWRQGTFDRLPAGVLRVVGATGAAALAVLCFTVGDVTFKYLGAETVTAVGSAGVIVFLVAAPAPSVVGRWLSTAPLTWLGRRSYGVYLWHWPLAEWTNRIPHRIGVPIGIGLSLVLAEVSWRLIERPAQVWARRRRPSGQAAPVRSGT